MKIKVYKTFFPIYGMLFKELCEYLEKLENTSKRLEKIIILKKFSQKFPKEAPLIFDIITGSYQKEIDKKSIGISLKTIFSVISFVSKHQEEKIEKEFNRSGDIGLVAEHFLMGKKQTSLNSKNLEFNDIISALNKISNTTGKNSNKYKKEILGNLFLSAKFSNEYKFLSRLLIDNLRIGVSEGVLKEAYINFKLPKIKTIEQSENGNEFELKEVNCKIINIKEAIEKYKFDNLIVCKNPRELYNEFLNYFEKKYNVTLSFRKIDEELSFNLKKILIADIKLFNPIKSMLGVRASSSKEALETAKIPSLADYKYDGMRVQIHNNKGNIKLYSRNQDEVTKQFPEITNYIKNNFSDLSFVIDSECVGFDFNTQKFLQFQILSRRILTKKIDEVSHIKIVVKAFDIMYLNDRTLIDIPYKERREILNSLFLKRPLKQELNFNIKKLNSINSK